MIEVVDKHFLEIEEVIQVEIILEMIEKEIKEDLEIEEVIKEEIILKMIEIKEDIKERIDMIEEDIKEEIEMIEGISIISISLLFFGRGWWRGTRGRRGIAAPRAPA